MGVTQTTVWLPDDPWKVAQLQARGEGGVNALIIRALEEYLGSLHRNGSRRLPGKSVWRLRYAPEAEKGTASSRMVAAI